MDGVFKITIFQFILLIILSILPILMPIVVLKIMAVKKGIRLNELKIGQKEINIYELCCAITIFVSIIFCVIMVIQKKYFYFLVLVFYLILFIIGSYKKIDEIIRGMLNRVINVFIFPFVTYLFCILNFELYSGRIPYFTILVLIFISLYLLKYLINKFFNKAYESNKKKDNTLFLTAYKLSLILFVLFLGVSKYKSYETIEAFNDYVIVFIPCLLYIADEKFVNDIVNSWFRLGFSDY